MGTTTPSTTMTMPTKNGCAWDTVSESLLVGWFADSSADNYELQLSSGRDEDYFAVYTSEKPYANLSLAYLRPQTTYWFRFRAHSQGQKSKTIGPWTEASEPWNCTTPSGSARSMA